MYTFIFHSWFCGILGVKKKDFARKIKDKEINGEEGEIKGQRKSLHLVLLLDSYGSQSLGVSFSPLSVVFIALESLNCVERLSSKVYMQGDCH